MYHKKRKLHLMAEELNIPTTSNRQEIYELLIPQIEAMVMDEPDLIANLANISAALKQAFNFLWVGFYLVKEDELVLGPFQGPIACTRIKKGKGVCGQAWEGKQTIVVPNVDEFQGHIACNSESKSEIVIPVIKNGAVHMLLDVDSDQIDDFSEVDSKYLEQLIKLIN